MTALPALGIPTPEAADRKIALVDRDEVALALRQMRFSAAEAFTGGERRRGDAVVVVVGLHTLESLERLTAQIQGAAEVPTNIESCTYALLGDSFAFIAIVTLAEATLSGYEVGLRAALPEFGVVVESVDRRGPSFKGVPMSMYAIVVERPGALAQLTHAFADNGLTIERLATWVTGDGTSRRCVLRVDVAAIGEAVSRDAVDRLCTDVLRQIDPEEQHSLILGRQRAPYEVQARDGRGSDVVAFWGPDRLGLVADATEALAEFGLNIESSTQNVLQGFAVFVASVSTLEGGPSTDGLEDRLREHIERSGSDASMLMRVLHLRTEPTLHEAVESDAGILNVFVSTEDEAGVLRKVVDALGELGIPVARMSGKVTCPDNPLFSLWLEADHWAPSLDRVQGVLAAAIGKPASVEAIVGRVRKGAPRASLPIKD